MRKLFPVALVLMLAGVAWGQTPIAIEGPVLTFELLQAPLILPAEATFHTDPIKIDLARYDVFAVDFLSDATQSVHLVPEWQFGEVAASEWSQTHATVTSSRPVPVSWV